jgi:carboxymethylenebutenolidase
MSSVCSDEKVPLPDGAELRTALSIPSGDLPPSGWPAVVVVHEIFGLTSEMAEVGDRLAGAGYVAAVPDFFSHGNRVACVARALADSSLGRPGPLVDDIEATRSWLAERPEVDENRLAVVGFCMGGGFALLHAANGPPGVRAAAVNYCGVPGDAQKLAKACPVVASFGGRDLVYGRYAERLERHLSSLGVPHDVKTYPDSGHSFMTQGDHPAGQLLFLPLRIGYDPEAAEDAWRRLFDFFDQHVRGWAAA